MNENLEFDYTVTKKPEGKYRLYRILMVIGYVAFALVFFFGLCFLHLYQYIAFIVLVEWILVFFTWRYVSIEYKYETQSGFIKFYNIYGGKKKKLVLDLRIKELSVIAPYDENAFKEAETLQGNNAYYFLSSEKQNPNRYYAVFTDNSGRNCTVHFEATQKTLKILHYYNASTVITKTEF